MKAETTITKDGIEFTVSGDYEKFYPGVNYNKFGDPGGPPEGGFFNECSVFLAGHDVTELLRPDVCNEIIEDAEEVLRYE